MLFYRSPERTNQTLVIDRALASAKYGLAFYRLNVVFIVEKKCLASVLHVTSKIGCEESVKNLNDS